MVTIPKITNSYAPNIVNPVIDYIASTVSLVLNNERKYREAVTAKNEKYVNARKSVIKTVTDRFITVNKSVAKMRINPSYKNTLRLGVPDTDYYLEMYRVIDDLIESKEEIAPDAETHQAYYKYKVFVTLVLLQHLYSLADNLAEFYELYPTADELFKATVANKNLHKTIAFNNFESILNLGDVNMPDINNNNKEKLIEW